MFGPDSRKMKISWKLSDVSDGLCLETVRGLSSDIIITDG